ncbi:MAG: hypothetical protein EZS28_041232 [Streblomastix strix]|uniref:Uncharacterized protein n=1 Tax=Streblomastix strix TaxID=222440 RepID=A0A5J4TZX1_9EUKA|nr:MAG: hypothetical protein EZS28_041232 [Streblomastix strix]
MQQSYLNGEQTVFPDIFELRDQNYDNKQDERDDPIGGVLEDDYQEDNELEEEDEEEDYFVYYYNDQNDLGGGGTVNDATNGIIGFYWD